MRNLFRKSLFKKNPFKKAAAATLMTAALVASAMANPTGPDVRNGQVHITGLGGAQVNIEQLTNRAIVNWDSFSIGAQEAVRFLQPSQMAVILNRVTGQDPSQILGSLSANGQVFLINPNGILFGPNSTVDVGGLVASTLSLSDEDFLAGNYNFAQDPREELASIINQGTITVSDGGYAVLTAPLVSNEGMIVANLGKVVLAGGESTTLNFDGRDLISYNVGALQAEAGTVIIPREAVSGMLSDMLGAEDRAGTLVQRADGSLALEGGSGLVYQAGTLRADGAEGQDAGTVVADSARLTVLGSDSVTAADGAGIDSSGGEVYVLSELESGTTVGYSGSLLSAQGGQTGDGGFIEFSGAYFALASRVDATAANGTLGTFLLDPQDIFVVDGPDMGAIPPDPGAGNDLTINDATIETLLAGAQVTLQADRHIDFADDVVIDEATGTLELVADFNNSNVGSVTFNDSSLTLGLLDVTGSGIELGTGTIVATTAVFDASVIDQADAGSTLQTTNLGFRSSDIRDSGNDPLRFDTQNLAIDVNGLFNSILLGDTSGGVTLVGSVTGLGGNVVNTTNSGGGFFTEFVLDATGNPNDPLTIQVAPDFSTGYIRSDGDIALQTGLTVEDGLLLIADLDNDGGGGITQTAGLISVGSALGLSAGDDGIGTAGALGDGLQIEVTNTFSGSGDLAIETSGNANVVETSADGVTLVDSVGVGGEVLPFAFVDGNLTGGSLQVSATGGATADLTIEGDIDSVGTSAELVADHDVIFEAPAMATVTNNLVIRADFDNDNDGTITFNALMGGANTHLNVPNLALALSDDFGTPGTPLEVNFDTFVVDTDPNGDGIGGTIYVRDTVGNFTLAPVTGISQSVTGARGAGDVNFESVTGQLMVDAPVSSSTGSIALVSDGQLSLSQSVTAAAGQNVNILAGMGGADIVQTGGVVSGSTIGLQGLEIGTATNSFDIDADSLAISSGGSAYISDPDALTLTDDSSAASTNLAGTPTAANDLRVQAGGDLTVPVSVMATDISLVSTGGGVAINSNVGDGATANVVLSASGDITGNSIVQATSVGLDGNNIGTANTSFNTNATNLSVDSEGDAYIEDVDGLNLAASVTAGSANPGVGGGVGDIVSGVSAQGDLRLEAGGDIGLSTNVEANELALLSTGNITVPFIATATQDVVFNAVGDITGGGVIVGTGVGLRGANIGIIGGNPVNIDAQNLALNADTDIHVEEAGNIHPSPLTLVDNVTATSFNDGTVGDTVTGNSAGDQMRIGTIGGLRVNAPNNGVSADTIDLIARGASIDQVAGSISATSLVLASATGISQTQGQSIVADNVGLSVGSVGNIGVPAGDALDITATSLAVNAPNANGNVNVRDSAGGLFLVNSVTGVGQTVTGSSVGGSLELETSGGDGTDLTINDDIMVGTNADLVSDSNVVVNSNVDVTGNLVVRADDDNNELGGISGGGTLTASGLGLAAGEDIGTAVTPFSVDVGTFAVDTDSDQDGAGGNVFVEDSTGLFTVASVTAVDETVGVARAAGDLNLHAAGGDLQLNIAASGNDVELSSVSSVVLNSDVEAVANAVIVADRDGSGNGFVQQTDAAVIRANSVGLSGGQGIGTVGDPIDVVAEELAMEVSEPSGSAYVNAPSGGLTIVDSVNGVLTNITGNSVGADYRIQGTGTLIVDDLVTAQNIALISTGDGLTVNQNLGQDNTQNIVLSATGDLGGSGVARATNVGLEANNIGSSGNSFNTAADNLTVDAAGDSFVSDQGDVNVIDTVTATAAGDTVTGNTAGGDYRLQSGGSLTVQGQISGQDISLVTTNGSVTLNDSLVATDNVVIRAQDQQIPFSTISQTNGVIQASNVGLRAGFRISGNGAFDELDITADNLVATAEVVSVRDSGGGITLVDSVTSTAAQDTVSGNSGDSLRFVAQNGALTTSGDVMATSQLQLLADQDVLLNSNHSAPRAVVVADFDNNGSGGISQSQGNIISVAQLGLSAGDAGIGAAGADVDAIDMAVDSVAIETTGNANILDSGGGLAVVDSVSTGGEILPFFRITGNSVGGSLELEANGGDDAILRINDALQVSTNADLVADDDVVVGGDITVAGSLIIRADDDQNDDGGIQQNPQVQVTVSATNLGLHSADDIGDPNGAPLDVDVTNLAVDTDGNDNQVGGSVNVRDINGNLVVTSVTGVSETVAVARSAGSLKIEAAEGTLSLNTAASAGTDAELVGGTDLNLNSSVEAGGDVLLTSQRDTNIGATVTAGGDIQVGSGRDVNLDPDGDFSAVSAQGTQVSLQANGNIVVRAAQDISNPNGRGTISATQIGLAAGREAGSIANPLLFDSQDLTYNAGNNLVAEDTSGGVRLIAQVTAVNDTVNGNSAGNDSRVVANEGDLRSDVQTTVGNNGELVTKTNGDIIVNGDYEAPNGNVVIRSAGDITGTGTVRAEGLGLDAPDGEIGSAAQPLRFDADTLTVGSRPFSTSPQSAFRRTPEVTAIVETVTDVGEVPVVQEQLLFFLDGSTFAQNNVNLVEAILEENLDTFDLIYNDAGWQLVEDEEFGTNRR